MQAVILVGGQAVRLRPLTTNTPKSMVPVLNRPFLEYVIWNLSRHGVKEIILAQHHLAGPIESYLGNGSQFGVRLTYVIEEEARGTAGAIKNVERYISGTFLALNGDIFSDLDITQMVKFHKEQNATATIALVPVEDPSAYGLIEADLVGRVRRFVEKPDPSEITTNLINAGTYVLEPEVLAQIPSGVPVSIERETYPLLVSSGQPVYAFSFSGYWMDVGTSEKYLQLHSDLLAGRSTWYTPATDERILIGEGCNIYPTAQLIGPVVIGPGCIVGEGSIIENSVLWGDVRLGNRVRVQSSVIADNCVLNDDSSVENAVLGDHVTVIAGGRVGSGSDVESGKTVG